MLLVQLLEFYVSHRGIALFYGSKNSYLTLAFQSYMVTAIIFVQWYFFGFSLASSVTSSSHVYGDFSLSALKNIGAGPLISGASIPIIESFTFSGFFAVCTVQIFLGSIIDRGRVFPSLVYGFFWCTLCYCPFAYWTWAPNGWLFILGDLDFAGGNAVHVASGVASLVYSLYLGKRTGWTKENPIRTRQFNPILNFIGSLLIYFPWLFFNSGTLTTITTPRTLYILTNTQLAASFAMVTFVFYDYFVKRKWSLLAASEGLITGLVFVTPACGYLEPWAIVIGSIVTALVCRSTYNINNWIGIDDTTHSFNVHAIGGIMGALLVGVFASPTVAGYDGITEISGGWIFHNWVQMGYQLAGTTAVVAWTAVMTYVLCFIIDHIPGLKLRISEEAELLGLDRYEIYEAQDYLENASLEQFQRVEVFNAREEPQQSQSSGESIELQDTKRPIPAI